METIRYNYFCDCCGYRFESDIPEKDEHGLSNDIACPHCGAWDVRPYTEEELKASVQELNEYEAKQALWEGSNDD